MNTKHALVAILFGGLLSAGVGMTPTAASTAPGSVSRHLATAARVPSTFARGPCKVVVSHAQGGGCKSAKTPGLIGGSGETARTPATTSG